MSRFRNPARRPVDVVNLLELSFCTAEGTCACDDFFFSGRASDDDSKVFGIVRCGETTNMEREILEPPLT